MHTFIAFLTQQVIKLIGFKQNLNKFFTNGCEIEKEYYVTFKK